MKKTFCLFLSLFVFGTIFDCADAGFIDDVKSKTSELTSKATGVFTSGVRSDDDNHKTRKYSGGDTGGGGARGTWTSKKEDDCRDKYAGNDEAIACCIADEIVDDSTKKCICRDKRKKWKVNICVLVDEEKKEKPEKEDPVKPDPEPDPKPTPNIVPKPVVPVPVVPPKPKPDVKPAPEPGVTPEPAPESVPEPEPEEPKECWYEFMADIECKNGNYYHGKKRYLLPVTELNGKTCEDFLKTYQQDRTKVLKIYEEYCAANNSYYIEPVSGPNAAEVSNAKGSLDKFFASAESEASVWKDSEGKFNTARLASDLTAGVVLGTVGGVVSGVVIKKKQVEKGFEVLHCTVGGQKIADWGDEFSVGLQR